MFSDNKHKAFKVIGVINNILRAPPVCVCVCVGGGGGGIYSLSDLV